MQAINMDVFLTFPELESSSLYFRELTYDDAVDLFELRSCSRVMKYMDIPAHTQLKDAERMIESIHNDFAEKKGINWAIIDKYSAEFLGYFGFWRITAEHCRAEIGYALKTIFWNRGIMSEVLSVMIPYGFNLMNLHRIEAEVNPANARSRAVLEKRASDWMSCSDRTMSFREKVGYCSILHFTV